MTPQPKTVALASDHAGYALKAVLIDHLRAAGHTITDLGPFDTASVDYPDYGYRLARAIAAGEAALGIVVCGSGIGIAIAVNRNPACRCAQVAEPLSATLARSHNDANVMALGGRLIGDEMAKACADAFLSTEFAGGRHTHRVDMLGHPQC